MLFGVPERSDRSVELVPRWSRARASPRIRAVSPAPRVVPTARSPWATSSASRARAGRSGTRSTGCPTAARSSADRAGVDQRGRPAAGYFTKRTAEAWLRGVLDEARRGTLPGMVRTGVTLRRGVRGVPALAGARPPAQALDAARLPLDRPRAPAAGLRRRAARGHHAEARALGGLADGGWRLGNRTKIKVLTVLHGVMERARSASTGCRATRWPTSRSRVQRRRASSIDVFSPEEVMALVRAADVRAGRRDLPDRRVHRPAPRRARRAALARRRLRRARTSA